MKKAIGVLLLTAACASTPTKPSKPAEPPPLSVFQKLNHLSDDSVFHIAVTVSNADGSFSSQSVGNAFLVDQGVLITVAHVFHLVQNTPYTVMLYSPKYTAGIAGKLMLIDGTNDVAIVEAPISGTAFTVRQAKPDEDLGFMVGYWSYA